MFFFLKQIMLKLHLFTKQHVTMRLAINIHKFLVERLMICIYVSIHITNNTMSLPGSRVAQWVKSLDLINHTSLSPIRRGFAPGFVIYKKGCIRLAAASNNAYQLLAYGRWFSPGIPASSTFKTGRHDIAEILLKVVLKHQQSN
jgi:hypothetical protein